MSGTSILRLNLSIPSIGHPPILTRWGDRCARRLPERDRRALRVVFSEYARPYAFLLRGILHENNSDPTIHRLLFSMASKFFKSLENIPVNKSIGLRVF